MCLPRNDTLSDISEVIIHTLITAIPQMTGSQCGCSLRSLTQSQNLRSARFSFTDTEGLRTNDHVLAYKDCNNSCCSEYNIYDDEHLQDTITSIDEHIHSRDFIMVTLTRGHPQLTGVTGELNIVGTCQQQ